MCIAVHFSARALFMLSVHVDLSDLDLLKIQERIMGYRIYRLYVTNRDVTGI